MSGMSILQVKILNCTDFSGQNILFSTEFAGTTYYFKCTKMDKVCDYQSNKILYFTHFETNKNGCCLNMKIISANV